jgi:hypothetical protein
MGEETPASPDSPQWRRSQSQGDCAPSQQSAAGVGTGPSQVPSEFTPVPDLLPEWIDIEEVCKEARRFVALHTMSTFNAVAINDGRRVFTANDRGGEFRRLFGRALTAANAIAAAQPNGRRVLKDAEAAIVYDCEKNLQWVAPRPAAIQFLSTQF